MTSREKRFSALCRALEAPPTPPAAAQTKYVDPRVVAPPPPPSTLKAEPVEPGFDAEHGVRASVLKELKLHRSVQRDFCRVQKARRPGDSIDAMLPVQIARNSHAILEHEAALERDFVPQHGPNQLISSQQLIMSSLFNVRGPAQARAEYERLVLTTTADGAIRFRGPELRQHDGLVFMSLLHMLRDFKTHTLASFRADEFCIATMGSYSGQARERLRQSIVRLQSSVLEFPQFSVQLAQRFDYPNTGPWSVALDEHIVALFHSSRVIWLDASLARKFPQGVCSWLYAYVEAQTRLIPTSAVYLRELSGSLATPESFERSLRQALGHLANSAVLDPGWSVADGKVRWRKQTLAP